MAKRGYRQHLRSEKWAATRQVVQETAEGDWEVGSRQRMFSTTYRPPAACNTPAGIGLTLIVFPHPCIILPFRALVLTVQSTFGAVVCCTSPRLYRAPRLSANSAKA